MKGVKVFINKNYYITKDSDGLLLEHDNFFEATAFASDWLQQSDGTVTVFTKRSYKDEKKFCCTLKRHSSLP